NPMEADKQWRHFKFNENGLTQSAYYGLAQSVDGRIWAGGSKFLNYDGKQWQVHPDARLQQYVNITTSDQGLLLVGSRFYGVFLFDGESWINYSSSEGLSSNTIISADILSKDHMYVATENGICRFDGTSWVGNVFPSDFNMSFEGGMILHDKQGGIWVNKSSRSWKRRAFPHNNRANIDANFIAHHYKQDQTPPETEITLFSEQVSSDGNTIIKWEGNDYFVQSAKKDLMFSYKLGDENWTPFSKEDHFTFLGLKSGAYQLKVRARDMDMNIDPTPAIIEFTVLPPVWKQSWFIALLLLFTFIVGVYQYRIISKNTKLTTLNQSLSQANSDLHIKSSQIEQQNKEILAQQSQIIEQSKILENANKDLGERNEQIQHQRDQLEDMITQVEELSKAKMKFFTSISHELRTPLTLISGPIHQLLEKHEYLSEHSRLRLYQIIDRNSSRLLKLINQLLELRRIEKSNLDVNLVQTNLNSFTRTILDLFENLAIEKDILLEFASVHSQSPFAIDMDKLEKILVNLISNAFKYTPSGGNIKVEIRDVKADTHGLPKQYENYVEISVTDSGYGISKENLKHVYERFFLAEDNKAGMNSSGIGLSYTKDLVYLLDGKIKVESELNCGTTFNVYLPEQNANIDSPEQPSNFMFAKTEAEALTTSFIIENEVRDALSDGKKERPSVLIVEDNLDMRLFLETILGERYRVLKAKNGAMGLEIAQTQTIDFILSDVMMPEMDGFEFCNQLKSSVATSHIPIVLLTAKTLDDNKIKGFTKGADAYITKPFNPDLLLVRIEKMLEQREQLRTVFNREFMFTPEKVDILSPDEELLKKIVTLMEDNLEDPDFNVNQLCKMVHLSHMHFIRKVKQLTGKKPIDLLKSYRLKRAKDLLVQNQLSISETAYKIGYDLPNSFSRAFKKEFGMSPKQFLKEHAN
ncbi:MAG: response regulator, partial [Bacteroidota bacterium]